MEKFLETDEKVAQDTNWGLMGDELVSQLRRIVITKNWNYGIPRNHSFLRRFLDVSKTIFLLYNATGETRILILVRHDDPNPLYE